MSKQHITIIVDGEKGRLSPVALIDILRSFVTVLDEVRKSVADQDDSQFAGWTIVSMSKTNPGEITLLSEFDRDIVTPTLNGFNVLNKSPKEPKYFTWRAMEHAKKMVASHRSEIASVTLKNGHLTATPTQHLVANVDTLQGTRHYTAETSLDGRLDMIRDKDKLEISIESDVYDKDIRCQCPDRLLGIAMKLFGRRVCVHGTVQYLRRTDEANHIDITDIQPLPEDTLRLEDMDRIDITGGESSEEYIRRLRDGT